ncbi:site-2 protease family protein [Nocardioides panacis]|uniref:Site-2 protease family protein n=1 Tax=Nocardioides panacis TaxID=2849501 RepID=A0A975Y137_9ACTN|nr:site-2 protease family protein [Nocardioides panacis]QWZ09111.1 site-2 protease family protein [Nocardioides panacis]
MTVLMYTVGVLLFVFGVAASIGLHECGHMYPAKKFGVKVTQYFIGFGRTVWSRRRGETEYGVKAVPLGGYVKLVGMLPPGPDDDPGTVRKSNTGMFAQIISDARSAEYELVEEGDEDRLFYKLPWWKKVVVMAGGPMVNIVLAFLLFAVVFMGHGVRTATTTVDSVSQCVIAVTKANATGPVRACTPADPVAPAKAAGLRPGDEIVGFNGKPVPDWQALQTAIRGNGDGAAALVVRRDGRDVTLTTKTTVSPRVDVNDPQRITKAGFLGVSPTVVLERQGPGFVLSTMANGTWETAKALGTMPVKLYHVGRAALGLEQRDQNGPMSVVGAGRVAGEMASAPTVPLSERFFSLLLLLAGLNLFLGMFNFVPLLPLDGGHIAGALYEGARRGVARLRRRPDPGFVDVARLLPVAYVMAGVILVMSVVLIYADIVAPVSFS